MTKHDGNKGAFTPALGDFFLQFHASCPLTGPLHATMICWGFAWLHRTALLCILCIDMCLVVLCNGDRGARLERLHT